jgi:hypothetical protein
VGAGDSLFSKKSRSSSGPTQPPLQWVQDVLSQESSSQAKNQEVDFSPMSTAKPKNVHTVHVPLLILYAFMALKITALLSYVLPQW